MLSLHLIIGASKFSIDSELAQEDSILEECQNFNPINPSQKIYSLMLPFIDFEERFFYYTSVSMC
ncbi:hypothetical protein PL9214880001 [Planktothrix tepida PCC 9214]|uniref:Uncharacterized protein n=2 Tax=Planktothrix TaxID=54304 RepID=A0A1J1LUB3_9CYAN|nr:hypothetical protein PL9214880001 [Planktothrix tepida PCC 9214]